MTMADMIIELMQDGKIDHIAGQTQSDAEARYMPQRKPEDGEIDWKRPAEDLFNFVRALTRPYPGAWSALENGGRLVVWRAVPFQLPIDVSGDEPGKVLARQADDSLVVRCGMSDNGTALLLIQDWEVQGECDGDTIVQGIPLRSADFAKQMARIVARHRQRYAHLRLSPGILRAAGD